MVRAAQTGVQPEAIPVLDVSALVIDGEGSVGSGGFANVYKAVWHPPGQPPKPCAVKVNSEDDDLWLICEPLGTVGSQPILLMRGCMQVILRKHCKPGDPNLGVCRPTCLRLLTCFCVPSSCPLSPSLPPATACFLREAETMYRCRCPTVLPCWGLVRLNQGPGAMASPKPEVEGDYGMVMELAQVRGDLPSLSKESHSLRVALRLVNGIRVRGEGVGATLI